MDRYQIIVKPIIQYGIELFRGYIIDTVTKEVIWNVTGFSEEGLTQNLQFKVGRFIKDEAKNQETGPKSGFTKVSN